MSSTTPATVKYNVGGQIFEVSRTLLEQYPDIILTRMASEMWKKDDGDQSQPFFLERDGELFKYVLRFMRDGGNVALSGKVPMSAFITELFYYGFTDVDESKISYDAILSIYGNVKTQLNKMEFDFTQKIYKSKNELETLEHNVLYMEIAHCLFLMIKSNKYWIGRKIQPSDIVIPNNSPYFDKQKEFRKGLRLVCKNIKMRQYLKNHLAALKLTIKLTSITVNSFELDYLET